MDWKSIAGDISKFAPLVGTLIGGPAGASVGALVAAALGTTNDASAVQQALVNNPDAAVKLRQIEADQEVQLRNLAVVAEQNRLVADTAAIQSVNQTMQSEAASDHWPTYTWRPFIGFVFGLTLLFVAAIVGYLVIQAVSTSHYEILANVSAIVGAFALLLGVPMPILGVSAYWRGKMQADPNVPTDNRG